MSKNLRQGMLSSFEHTLYSVAVLMINLILMRIRSWIRTGNNGSGFGSRSFLYFFNKKLFSKIFSHIFILKLDEPFRNEEIFSKVQIWILGVKFFFSQFLVDILALGSGSVDPHIFVDPDPGRQNLADPTETDPKHCSVA